MRRGAVLASNMKVRFCSDCGVELNDSYYGKGDKFLCRKCAGYEEQIISKKDVGSISDLF